MGVNLPLRTESHGAVEDHRWLGSAHATDTGESITLDGDLFAATFPDGTVPSGVVVAEVSATGLYGPYDNAAVDGRETAKYHLFTTQHGVEAGARVGAAGLWHGQVIVAFLPANHGLNAAAAAELSHFHYVGDVPA